MLDIKYYFLFSFYDYDIKCSLIRKLQIISINKFNFNINNKYIEWFYFITFKFVLKESTVHI